MNKIKVRQTVSRDYYDSLSIEELANIIQSAAKSGATMVEFESEYDSSSVEMELYFHRDETDEEYKKRLDRENANKKYREAADLREFERLKKLLNK